MSLRLRIEHGQDAGTTYRLPTAGVYTLGRTPQNSIRVLDMKVSKEHCELRIVGDGANLKCALHDPGSTHGCELNGQPVPKGKNILMRPGDELRLGLTILRLLSAGDSDRDAKPVEGRTVEAGAAAGASKEAESTPTLPADDLVGKKLGGYQVEKKIGAGGMGGVYLAEQVSLNRQVALKVLNETFAADSAFVDQFVNEARAAGALNHPNVVQVYDVGSDQGRYFFSMEVMPGGSLEEKLREGPIAWEDGLNYFIDAANALIFANKREILHRDVKPDNLMVSEDDSAKLCDLGLAKKSEVSDLMDQGIIGTPHFISPEAIRRKPDIDHRTDLYSLGCSFYRIFTGKNPYPAGTVKEILLGHLNKPIPRINALNRDVPREIDEIVARLMAKDPAERVQTPDELLRELDKIRTKYNLEAHGIKPASRKPLIIGGVLAAIAIGVAIFFATKPSKTITQGRTPEEIALQKKNEQDAVEADLRKVVQDAKAKLLELEGKRIQGDLGPENYKQSTWTRLIKEYRESADGWQTKRDEWTTAQGESEDEVIQGFYGDYGTQLDEQITKARTTAKKQIEDEIADFKKTEAARKEARAQALADLDKAIGDFAQKLKKLEGGDYAEWIELEKTVRGPELADTLKELRDRKIGKYQLLKEKEDIEVALKKHGFKLVKDQPLGMEAVKRAVASIDRRRKALVDALSTLLSGTPGHKEFQEAKQLVQAAIDALPAGFEVEQKDAPLVVAAMKRIQELAERRGAKLKTDHAALIEKEYGADRRTYFDLARKLWNPDSGHLPRLDYGQARLAVKNAQGKLAVGTYKELAASWLPLIDALERLFQRIVEAEQKDAWTDDDYMGVDRKGRPKKQRIRGISKNGVEWEKDPVPFHRSSPRFLLDNLFFFEGKPRIKPEFCDAIDHAGLGLLAELAGRYDIAAKQYQAGAAAEGDLGLAVRRRLTQLGLERQAAEKFFAVMEYARELVAWLEPFEAMEKGLDTDPDAWPKEERERLETERVQREQLMAQMLKNLDDLRERADIGGTMWGSALAEGIHPRATYAGEPAPDAPTKRDGPPKKDAPKKDDPPKKDADAKKGGNGGDDGN